MAIAELNTLAVWTGFGWLVALVWSLSPSVTKPAADNSKPASSVSDLNKLAELREKTLISQEEFEREKNKII